MKQFILKLLCFSGLLLHVIILPVFAQDTVRIDLQTAEARFLKQNLSLLAERYNIDIAQAQVIQAKLFDNPTLSLTGNLFDPKQQKFFNVSNSSGQYDIAVQQLIRLAGKRNKEIKLAATNVSISMDKFSDLLRTLDYSLRCNFYEIFYLQKSVNNYNKQISSLEKLSTAYDELEKKAVVTLKDALRIKSLLYSLKSEQTNLQNALNDQQASMQLLMQSNHIYFIAANENVMDNNVENLNLASLIDTAYANRPDLSMSKHNLLYSQQNFTLQKALAKTDLTIGGEFDKRGSFVDNASFLTVSMDLPFFKRNQGNIKAAKFSADQGKVLLYQQQQSIENEVSLAYTKLINTNKMLNSIDSSFENSFEKLLQGVTENFQKKNISLIEFTDFYESYTNNTLQLNQLRNDRQQAMETLQFVVGKKIFNQ